MLEIWEKDSGYFLGWATPDQIVKNGKIRGGILFGFLVAVSSEGIVSL